MAVDDGDGKVEPYANFPYAHEGGTQDVAGGGPVTPCDDLTPYGTQTAGDYDSSPDNATPAGPRQFDAAAEHSRATSAQAPSYSRGGTYDGGVDGRDGVAGTRKADMPRLPTPTDVY